MRIHVVSDLHDEFHQTRIALPADRGDLGHLDFIISAGDVYRGSAVDHEKRWRLENECPVIKVAGNHEHYKIRKTVQENIAELRSAADKANEEELNRILEQDLWTAIRSDVLHDQFDLSLDQVRYLLRQLMPLEHAALSLERLKEIHSRAHPRRDPSYLALNEINFLENDSVILSTRDGEQVKVIGATLWTDFRLHEDQGTDRQAAMIKAMQAMNDYRHCHGGYDGDGKLQTLRPAQTLEWHEQSVEYIVEELRKPFDGIRVVVTHHSPARECLNPKFQKNVEDRKVSASFGSDLSWICEDDELAPDLWVSGHGHNSFSFEIGRTLHIGNPRGYHKSGGGSENRNFDPSLVVTSDMLPRFRTQKATP
jgi:predicted phosphodiesterase